MKRDLEIWRGEPYPLGATLTEEGVNFALYTKDAIEVELCLFDSPAPNAGELRIPVTEQTDPTWHVFLPDIGPGQLYCYRIYGAYEPARGLRFNHSKLLLDPYAQAIAEGFRSSWRETFYLASSSRSSPPCCRWSHFSICDFKRINSGWCSPAWG